MGTAEVESAWEGVEAVDVLEVTVAGSSRLRLDNIGEDLVVEFGG